MCVYIVHAYFLVSSNASQSRFIKKKITMYNVGKVESNLRTTGPWFPRGTTFSSGRRDIILLEEQRVQSPGLEILFLLSKGSFTTLNRLTAKHAYALPSLRVTEATVTTIYRSTTVLTFS